jgi:DNA-binding YbaB/EbfC family protein
MFKELGQLASLLRNMPQMSKLKEEMDGLQQRLGQISAEGDAGGGMVKVRVNGKLELVACTINDEAMGDREMLEDLVRAAVNQAMEKARVQAAQETSKMAGNLGLPAGLDLPGLGG